MTGKTAGLNIEKMLVADLIGSKAEYNPRDIKGEELDGLRFSMNKFGYMQNIIYNKTTGNIVSGHQRIDILHSDGYDSVEVSVVELSEEDERKLNVVMNSSTITGDFTTDLNAILSGILDSDPEFFDMTGLSLLFVDGEWEEEEEEEEEEKDIVPGMDLMPYESYDCILVVCKKRDDFMFLSSKMGLGGKIVISSPVVENKKLGYTRCVEASKLISSFGDKAGGDDGFNL